MKEDLVSIVTPAYNAGRFVTETIKSVQAQDYRAWELLVVDDCSRDDTCEQVAALGGNDPRVRLLRQERNAGPAAARNRALEAAQGRWIAFLDSDDVWLEGKLRKQLAFMKDLTAPLSFTRCRRISEDGKRIGYLVRIPPRMSYTDLLCNTAIVTSTVIVDRKQTGDFRMRHTYYDDYAAWLELLRPGRYAYGLPEDLVRYRVVDRSVSRNKARSALMVWRTYREVEQLGVAHAAWCFVNYAARGWIKYRRF